MKSAAQTHSVPLMEGLRNLEKGYDRKFALSYCENEVWAALEALEAIEAMAGAAGAGQIAAMPIAERARKALR